ncbi:hypothetical protein [Flaviaesturariibacter amylovorans]|uniref:Uncharacterized protein n=1 Tax=Flaviaesturariibacter amylovorans TaxID=1084520 RepID=A0ABP8GD78_9BACT
MSQFVQDLRECVDTLRAGDAGATRAALLQQYRLVLPYEYQYEGLALSDADAAFLQLYSRKADALRTSFWPALLNVAGAAYPHTEKEHGAPLAALLELQCILLPHDDGTIWELDYAVPFDEAIFHVRFDGWDFRDIGQSH